MDGSGSIGKCEFEEGKKAMMQLMEVCEADRITSCQYAGVTYSSRAAVSFNFKSPDDAIKEMSKIRYPGGETSTHEALEKADGLLKGLYRNCFAQNQSCFHAERPIES